MCTGYGIYGELVLVLANEILPAKSRTLCVCAFEMITAAGTIVYEKSATQAVAVNSVTAFFAKECVGIRALRSRRYLGHAPTQSDNLRG
jgi:hypothetical protein